MKLTRIIPALITLMVIVIIPAFSQSVQFTKEQKQKLADANSRFIVNYMRLIQPTLRSITTLVFVFII